MYRYTVPPPGAGSSSKSVAPSRCAWARMPRRPRLIGTASGFCSIRYVAERTGQRREGAADDVEFVCERMGWLPFAARSGSPLLIFNEERKAERNPSAVLA